MITKMLAICYVLILLSGQVLFAVEKTICRDVMAGEVTQTSAILQSRLSSSNAKYTGRFAVSASQNFDSVENTDWLIADETNDHICKAKIAGLSKGTRYFYQLEYGKDRSNTTSGPVGTFKTLAGESDTAPISFVVVTGMNYAKFHNEKTGYKDDDKYLGYPALKTIAELSPDFFIGTGDNVYFDHPKLGSATDLNAMRHKYHEQFTQQNFIDLFAKVPTYWEKDDHDYRYNDCDNSSDKLPLGKTGNKVFYEQLPVVDPADDDAVTYRTHRINKHLQIWLVEGRDYRSDNNMTDGPDKTIWGAEQRDWLKRTLLASDAEFKLLISPTPMIGPDDAYKKDNHCNLGGFRNERDPFFDWLKSTGIDKKNFYIICGDRHWQYHSVHPTGIEEFSCGALVDANSRIGRMPGDKNSTDPKGLIVQPYCMTKPSGGFLNIEVTAVKAVFTFYDEKGTVLYRCTKPAK